MKIKIILSILLGFSATSCIHKTETSKSTDFTKLRFSLDHVVNEGETDPVFYNLGKRGFTLQESYVDHPGPVRCRFINYSTSLNDKRRFIEFCQISDKKKYIENLKTENKTFKQATASSMAVAINKDLETYYESIKDNFAAYAFKFQHRNYNWKQDNVSRLPGWNHVWFDKPLYDNFFIFMSEREPTEKGIKRRASYYRKKVSDRYRHANGTNNLIGVLLKDFDSTKLEEFLLTERDNSRLALHDGTNLWFTDKAKNELKNLLADKVYPIQAVILATHSLKLFRSKAKPDMDIDFFGEDAAVIKLPETMWDIIVVER